jgi:hypothetical protein
LKTDLANLSKSFPRPRDALTDLWLEYREKESPLRLPLRPSLGAELLTFSLAIRPSSLTDLFGVT